jgi:hypothetical protein
MQDGGSPLTWSKLLLVIAGLHDCAIGLYHFVLPTQWNWAAGLQSLPASLVWGIYTLNFSWSLLMVITGFIILYAAAQDLRSNLFVRRVVFGVGLFWLLHGTHVWFYPVPVPHSLLWLKYVLVGFTAIAIILHWLPLWIVRGGASKNKD